MLSIETDMPVKATPAKMTVISGDGVKVGEAGFSMGDFSYGEYKKHRLYLT